MIWQDDRGALRDIYYKRGKNDQGFISTTNEYKEQAMLYCTPNPFNTKLLIRFSTIMNYDNLKITIYNSLGRKVRELFPKKLSSIIAWNGLDDKGNKLPPGVYLIRYLRDKTFVTEKVIKCNN
jgi:flagellar hook assembly protein FlgD